MNMWILENKEHVTCNTLGDPIMEHSHHCMQIMDFEEVEGYSIPTCTCSFSMNVLLINTTTEGVTHTCSHLLQLARMYC